MPEAVHAHNSITLLIYRTTHKDLHSMKRIVLLRHGQSLWNLENRFTGESAYAGCSIDGSNSDGETITYLSRADFKGTFPKHYGNRSGATVSSAASYVYNDYNFKDMPKLGDGSVGPLTLYRTTDGSELTNAKLKSGEGIEINHDLMMKLGGDYESEQWDQLLDQMTYA